MLVCGGTGSNRTGGFEKALMVWYIQRKFERGGEAAEGNMVRMLEIEIERREGGGIHRLTKALRTRGEGVPGTSAVSKRFFFTTGYHAVVYEK